ncbi:putative dynamin GTPase [Lupinus albus]|uniref:Putative dynamin GTPase n=1 Tax=Lupinus albus TaxID=3870 RepID=A0A6A4R6T2_LUPAL|nr:putative dynamin GTPase [Lupinus albus]
MLYTASISNYVGAFIDGAADPSPELWGKTTAEEQSQSGIGAWPGVITDINPPNATLRLYGGAAFERVIHEFRCAAYSIECPQVSREKVANILLAHGGRGGGRGIAEAAAEIARAAAKSWLAPLLDSACDRLAFVLGSLFDLALERHHSHESEYGSKAGDMDGYVGFHAAIRCAYNRFVKDLAKQCKQLVKHQLDSVTSSYSQVLYVNDFQPSYGINAPSNKKFSQASAPSSFLELSDTSSASHDVTRDQENIPPQKNTQDTTPGDPVYGGSRKELGIRNDMGPRKRLPRMTENGKISDHNKVQNGGLLFGNGDNRTGSAYSEICFSAAQHFVRLREVLVERGVTSTLNSGFLTPCRDRLLVALGLDLFALNDVNFMDMFVAPGAIDVLQTEQKFLKKRQKILQFCLIEFKTLTQEL